LALRMIALVVSWLFDPQWSVACCREAVSGAAGCSAE
jgi:hypothetical protein